MTRSISGTWRPPVELIALRERLSEVFDAGGAVAVDGSGATEAALRWTPSVDMISAEENVIVAVEVSGMTPDELNVEVDARTLTIRGERQRVSEGARFHRIERAMGVFERTLTLPHLVDPTRCSAAVSNGVLTVTMPRVEERSSETRTIDVAG